MGRRKADPPRGYGIQQRREWPFRKAAWILLVAFFLQTIPVGALPPVALFPRPVIIRAMDPQLRKVLQCIDNNGLPIVDIPGEADGRINALLPDIVAQTDPGPADDAGSRL